MEKFSEQLAIQREREEFEQEKEDFEFERQEINRRLLEMATVLETERQNIQTEKKQLEEKIKNLEGEIGERVRRTVLEQVEKSANYEENLIKEIQTVSQRLEHTERENKDLKRKLTIKEDTHSRMMDHMTNKLWEMEKGKTGGDKSSKDLLLSNIRAEIENQIKENEKNHQNNVAAGLGRIREETDFTALQEENGRLKEAVASLKQRLETLENGKSENIDEMDTRDSEKDEAERRAKRECAVQTEAEEKKAADSAKPPPPKFNQADIKFNTLKKENEELKEEIEGLKEDLEDAENEISELTEKNQELQDELEKIKDKAAKDLEEYQNRETANLRELQKTRKNTITQLEKRRTVMLNSESDVDSLNKALDEAENFQHEKMRLENYLAKVKLELINEKTFLMNELKNAEKIAVEAKLKYAQVSTERDYFEYQYKTLLKEKTHQKPIEPPKEKESKLLSMFMCK